MTIQINRHATKKQIVFAHLGIGDYFFMDGDFSLIYMKMEKTMLNGGFEANAVTVNEVETEEHNYQRTILGKFFKVPGDKKIYPCTMKGDCETFDTVHNLMAATNGDYFMLESDKTTLYKRVKDKIYSVPEGFEAQDYLPSTGIIFVDVISIDVRDKH